MDGENNGKPYEQMDDLGVPLFLETPLFLVYISLRIQNLPDRIGLMVKKIPSEKNRNVGGPIPFFGHNRILRVYIYICCFISTPTFNHLK